jgi:hypothetical protein
MKLLLYISAMCIFTSGCAVWPAGDDPKGKELRAQAEIIVAAIISYRNEKDQLPKTLNELIPHHIRSLSEVEEYFIYLPEESTLIYDYLPTWPQQGQISCGTKIGSGKWACLGYI